MEQSIAIYLFKTLKIFKQYEHIILNIMGKFFEQYMYAQKHNIYIDRNLSIIGWGLVIQSNICSYSLVI